MSATHSGFGPVAWKSRSTRSGAGRACLSRCAVIGPPRRDWRRPERMIGVTGLAPQPGHPLAAVPLSGGPQLGIDTR